jgi:hypothetical protein
VWPDACDARTAPNPRPALCLPPCEGRDHGQRYQQVDRHVNQITELRRLSAWVRAVALLTEKRREQVRFAQNHPGFRPRNPVYPRSLNGRGNGLSPVDGQAVQLVRLASVADAALINLRDWRSLHGLRYPFPQYGIQNDVRYGMAASYPDRARQPCSGLSQNAINPNLGMIEAKMTSFRKSYEK